MEQTCLDHTDGVDSLTTERNFVLRPKEQLLGGVPAAVHAIVQKDKNTTLIQVMRLLPLSTSLGQSSASSAFIASDKSTFRLVS